MIHPFSRRHFIRSTAMAGAGIGLAGLLKLNATGLANPSGSELFTLSSDLLHTWGTKLLSMQVLDKSQTDNYGGILSPANNKVHGRVGDTIYPFFHLAHKTNDNRYIDAAVLLYRWMEKRVSQPDGSWLNEPQQGSWKGTTVFSAIALAETLKHHGEIMDPSLRSEMEARLRKAGDFIYNTFTIDFGNINYPITASYGLSLLGELLGEQKFREKGQLLAHQALKFFTANDKLIFGEGDPYYTKSAKGCLSVDLGYNVEESLPALVLYGHLNNDEEVLA
ncbi:MAG TPA: twin-arginine translocation signal domain-containing protein, partial [Chitinophagaceae bacterium]|nr:twin-arginine translocation signal domain-containing protein [Chitinophagaceae bacterium]